MVDTGILITGGIGIVSNIVTWLLTRKKYRTEVDSNEIENLKKSLEFYESIVRDNNKKLQFYIDLAESNRIEVYRLKGILYRIIDNSCLSSSCKDRKFYSEEQIKEMLGDVITQYGKHKHTENNDSEN